MSMISWAKKHHPETLSAGLSNTRQIMFSPVALIDWHVWWNVIEIVYRHIDETVQFQEMPFLAPFYHLKVESSLNVDWWGRRQTARPIMVINTDKTNESRRNFIEFNLRRKSRRRSGSVWKKRRRAPDTATDNVVNHKTREVEFEEMRSENEIMIATTATEAMTLSSLYHRRLSSSGAATEIQTAKFLSVIRRQVKNVPSRVAFYCNLKTLIGFYLFEQDCMPEYR